MLGSSEAAFRSCIYCSLLAADRGKRAARLQARSGGSVAANRLALRKLPLPLLPQPQRLQYCPAASHPMYGDRPCTELHLVPFHLQVTTTEEPCRKRYGIQEPSYNKVRPASQLAAAKQQSASSS